MRSLPFRPTGRGWLVLAACAVAAAAAAPPAAFVATLDGTAQVLPAAGDVVAARVGRQLAAGDRMVVTSGEVSVVLLSGRIVTVRAPDTLAVGELGVTAAPMLARLAAALEEITGTEEGPEVHGMARDFGVIDAYPANTNLRDADFLFGWDPVDGVHEYVMRIYAGGDTIIRTIADTTLDAADLGLTRGRTYTWCVAARGTVLPMTSAAVWVRVASDNDLARLRAAEAALDSVLSPAPVPSAVRAALYVEHGFIHEAKQLLAAARAARTPPTR